MPLDLRYLVAARVDVDVAIIALRGQDGDRIAPRCPRRHDTRATFSTSPGTDSRMFFRIEASGTICPFLTASRALS